MEVTCIDETVTGSTPHGDVSDLVDLNHKVIVIPYHVSIRLLNPGYSEKFYEAMLRAARHQEERLVLVSNDYLNELGYSVNPNTVYFLKLYVPRESLLH